MASLFSDQRSAQFTSVQWHSNSAVNGRGISARLVAERNQQFLSGGSNVVARATEMALSDFGKRWRVLNFALTQRFSTSVEQPQCLIIFLSAESVPRHAALWSLSTKVRS
jgi:hypothetical protein